MPRASSWEEADMSGGRGILRRSSFFPSLTCHGGAPAKVLGHGDDGHRDVDLQHP